MSLRTGEVIGFAGVMAVVGCAATAFHTAEVGANSTALCCKFLLRGPEYGLVPA